MGRFDRRVAVITGAARGIGFGIAQRLASEGASIAILDLDEAAAQAAAGDDLEQEKGWEEKQLEGKPESVVKIEGTMPAPTEAIGPPPYDLGVGDAAAAEQKSE